MRKKSKNAIKEMISNACAASNEKEKLKEMISNACAASNEKEKLVEIVHLIAESENYNSIKSLLDDVEEDVIYDALVISVDMRNCPNRSYLNKRTAIKNLLPKVTCDRAFKCFAYCLLFEYTILKMYDIWGVDDNWKVEYLNAGIEILKQLINRISQKKELKEMELNPSVGREALQEEISVVKKALRKEILQQIFTEDKLNILLQQLREKFKNDKITLENLRGSYNLFILTELKKEIDAQSSHDDDKAHFLANNVNIDQYHVSTPDAKFLEPEIKSKQDNKYRIGYHQTIGGREYQEDALACCFLSPKVLSGCSSEKIAQYLWTTYQNLDEPKFIAGTTASTVVYSHKDRTLTIATVGDSNCFAAISNNAGKIVKVVRLNSVVHNKKQAEETEKERIKPFRCDLNRLALTRAIGDLKCGDAVVPDAQIDIFKLAAGVDLSNIRIIVASDGFTDGAGRKYQTKKDHEAYLLKKLQEVNVKATPEADIARKLVDAAKNDGSGDNISVAIHTLGPNDCLVGVYDGHGGKYASHHVANYISKMFLEQRYLSDQAYQEQGSSTYSLQERFIRDNPDLNKPQVLTAEDKTPPSKTSLFANPCTDVNKEPSGMSLNGVNYFN